MMHWYMQALRWTFLSKSQLCRHCYQQSDSSKCGYLWVFSFHMSGTTIYVVHYNRENRLMEVPSNRPWPSLSKSPHCDCPVIFVS